MSDMEQEETGCCAVQCQYIVPVACGIAIISMIPTIWKFVTAHYSGKLKSDKRLFFAVLLFFGTIFLALSSWALFNATMCDYPRLNHISHNVFMQLYTLESMLFVGILFHRLHKIFQDTELALNACSTRSFLTFYTIAAILVAAYGVLLANDLLFDSLMGLIGGIIGLFGLILIIWIVCLYLHKLTQVYKYKHDDVNLLPIITKTSLLCVVSTLATFNLIVSLSLLTTHHSPFHSLVHELLTVGDIFTNYLCVWLSFQHFEAYYQRMCGCCHTKCQKLWMWRFHRDAVSIMMQIQTPRSPSIASATLETSKTGMSSTTVAIDFETSKEEPTTTRSTSANETSTGCKPETDDVQ